MRKVAIAAGAVVVVAAGCRPDHGTVIGRRHDPGYVYTTTSCTSTYKGSTVCVPVTQYMPPTWELKLRTPKGDTGWHDVDQREYDNCVNGDQYPEGCVKAAK